MLQAQAAQAQRADVNLQREARLMRLVNDTRGCKGICFVDIGREDSRLSIGANMGQGVEGCNEEGVGRGRGGLQRVAERGKRTTRADA